MPLVFPSIEFGITGYYNRDFWLPHAGSQLLRPILPISNFVALFDRSPPTLHRQRHARSLMPWLHVQLLHATHCNNCRQSDMMECLQLLQRVVCNNCTWNHGISATCYAIRRAKNNSIRPMYRFLSRLYIVDISYSSTHLVRYFCIHHSVVLFFNETWVVNVVHQFVLLSNEIDDRLTSSTSCVLAFASGSAPYTRN